MENYDGQELSEFTSQFIRDNSGKEKVNLSRREKKKLDKQLKTEQANIKNNIKKQEKERKKKFADQLKEREIELGKLTKKERKERLKANNLIDFIGYNSMFENGICEVEKGLYSETIAFSDVSYQSAREEDQRTLYSQMCSLYDSFGSDVILQFNIINTPLTPEELDRRVFFDVDKQSDVKLKKYAEIYQNILEDTAKTYYEYERAKEEVEKAKERLNEKEDMVWSVRENIEEICKLEMVKNGLIKSEDVINDYTAFAVFFKREENGDLRLHIDHNVCAAMHERALKKPIYIEKNRMYKKNWLKKLKKACSDNKYWEEFLSY